ncbi:hypothetical protein QE368_001696 [Asaia bogorensis NBRC 16594]|nr:hypothetical protein [Asaia bogorensis NBRC 16594]
MRGCMFAIESWPDGQDMLHGMASLSGQVPHVRAGNLEDTLASLTRQDLDMVIWTRRPPQSWVEAMREALPPLEPLSLSGTVEQVMQAAQALVSEEGYPEFLAEDLAHCASLAAALSGSNRISLVLTTGVAGGQPEPGGRLSLFCAYGHDEASWNSGKPFTGPPLTRFAPFSLAFMPVRDESRVRIDLDKASLGVVLFLRAD